MAYYIAYRHALIIYFIRFCTEIAVKIDFINKTLKIMNNEFNILSENVIIGTISLQNIIRYILSPWQQHSINKLSQLMENRISPINPLINGPSLLFISIRKFIKVNFMKIFLNEDIEKIFGKYQN